MKKNHTKKLRFTSVITLALLLISYNNLFAQTAPSGLSYVQDSAIAYRGSGQNSCGPTVNNGGSAVTYSLVNAIPGVTINPVTGQIFWANSVGAGKYNLTVKATNAYGNTTCNYYLQVIPNPDDFLTPHFTSKVTSNLNYTGAISATYSGVDVYTPVGDTNTIRPVFMFMHGGGFSTSNDKSQSYVVAFCNYMATCGYVAYGPNYNVGGGHTFTQNLKALKDFDACLNSIRNNTINYPTTGNFAHSNDFLFVGGGSAGAHLSCNFSYFDGSTNYGGFVPNRSNVIALADCWGSSPTTDRLYNFSSLNANSMPTFIVQGSADQTVPVQNSIDLANALSAAGSYYDFWDISGEKHGCPNHLPQIEDTMAHFFNRVWKRSYPQTINPILTPVKLTHFNAVTLNNQIVLNWTTVTEENTKIFVIEKSEDGVRFYEYGTVMAKGFSAVNQTYQFVDKKLNAHSTCCYYRLKIVDKNAAVTYSDIVKVDLSSVQPSTLIIISNPLSKGQPLQYKYASTSAENVCIQIYDAAGKLVASQTQQALIGVNSKSISIKPLPSGTYYLSLRQGNQNIASAPFIIY